MDRAEATGLGLALAGHAVLLAILSLGLASATKKPLLSEPMEVSFVEEVGLKSAVTELSTEAPAPSVAPIAGPPEEAAPMPEPVPAPPEPLPPPPRPVEARPQPKVQPPPQPKVVLKPVPQKPAPQKPATKPAPAKPAPAQAAPARPAPQPARPAPPAARPNSAAAGSGSAQQTRGSRLGRDFLKGVGSDPTPSTSQKPTGAVLSPIALSGIKSAITRQIQPCADRQVNPGPGANEIVVTLNLRLNRDGSLAARPSVVRTSGVGDANSRYEKRVTDLAIAAYTGCSPLRNLPEELYRTANGGWSNINMNYKLP
ncbi:MAG: cell envelope biogenesis protein TolA [Pseudomonadota bacterium]|nr:cell envelope biogenesis protein TolA [Pseudomonadota bacterium]